ncbi:hypothetical protein F5884DRAFT_905976 [Xylogone sp. PMI_703]|nr:hypothetical protein F5884DRAFT_905976 [Xylogone sp. PMI_703]
MPASKEQASILLLLPNEVLSQIMRDSCLEAGDLFRLSLVNKRLSKATRKGLYENINLCIDSPMAVKRLLETIRGNADFLPLIHHLELKYTPGKEWGKASAEINQAFKQILGLNLPALKSLEWEVDGIVINLYEVNPVLPVRSIYVKRASFEEATMLLLLPKIEKIGIGYIHDSVEYLFGRRTVPSFFMERGSRFSTATDIRIETRFDPFDFFSPFVNWPRELQSLDVSIIVIGNLSPKAIDLYLEPVRDSLRDLSIVAITDEYTTITDETFIHFEGFKYLEHLNTSASILFGRNWDRDIAERAGLYRRLPTTLKTFKLFFDNFTVAVRTGREDAYIDGANPPDYLWIMELTNLPNLELVRLEEGTASQDDSPNFISFDWEPHHLISDLFASHNIKLDASLRSYKQHAEAMERLMAERAAR